jgi:ribosomal protein S18 acetylase RimI-like enzyme
MKQRVRTFYLEMTDRAALRPSRGSGGELALVRAEIPSPELSRFLYTAVGGDWYWVDRLGWTYDRWLQYLSRPALETWVGYVAGTPAGYFELDALADGSQEIAYFGLLPQFTGRGLGGALLTAAIERAWERGTHRVCVNTCTLDGPAALRNYQARGLRVYREQEADVDLPDETPGPWPGARGA